MPPFWKSPGLFFELIFDEGVCRYFYIINDGKDKWKKYIIIMAKIDYLQVHTKLPSYLKWVVISSTLLRQNTFFPATSALATVSHIQAANNVPTYEPTIEPVVELSTTPNVEPTFEPSSYHVSVMEEKALCDILSSIKTSTFLKCNSSAPPGKRLSDDPCYDSNIKCDTAGKIVGISIVGGGYSFSPWVLPASIGNLHGLNMLTLNNMNLVGHIPDTFGNLTNLQFLQLSGNALTGPIPVIIAKLSNLQHLDLSSNKFTGLIPSQIAALNHLQYLELSFNSLIGQLPASIGNLSQLTTLRICCNHLTGTIPAEICNISQLQTLELSQNLLSGHIPAYIDNLQSLEILDLAYNTFSGPIPASIGNLKFVQGLYLELNGLTGHIPATVGNLTHLTAIDVSMNKLTGRIPASIGSLNALTDLMMYTNALTGPLPDTIGNLSNLVFMNVEGNRLTGSIPFTIGNLRKLITFDVVSGNMFSGVLPTSIGNLKKLQQINLSGMKISGRLPVSISNITGLTLLDISGNLLTGPIPADIGSLTNLLQISLQNNQLSGFIPNSIGMLTQLKILDLYNNKLTGFIPTTIGNLTSLGDLSLYNNLLSGPIPSSIGGMTKLSTLKLYDNKLSGSIPVTIGDLLLLQDLYLQRNQLTGSIPDKIGALVSLQYLALYENQLKGPIPDSIGNLNMLLSLELQYNQLSGHIPVSITTLFALETLTLYSNQLRGHIPWAIGNMKNLRALELQLNLLSGPIPDSICNLTNIPNLYLYSNRLTGSIPNDIGKMGNLQNVKLYSNKLTGVIPESIGGLNLYLNTLDLHSNYLRSPIPPTMENLQYIIQGLDISYNNFTGPIPSYFSSFRYLRSMFLQSNQFTGPIPSLWGFTLTNLLFLSLSGNKLNGTIPTSLGWLPQLQTLDISANYLSGTLAEISLSSSLIALNLSLNNFSGPIPSFFGSLTYLASLNLDGNSLQGQIPSILCDLSVLAELTLANNSFSCYPTCLSVDSIDFIESYPHCQGDQDDALCEFSSALNMSIAISKAVFSSSLTIESDHPLPLNFATSTHEVYVEGAIDYFVSVDSRTFSFLTEYSGIGINQQPPISFCPTKVWANSTCFSIGIVSHSDELPGILSVAPYKVPWRNRFFIIILDNIEHYWSATWGYRLTIDVHSRGVGWDCTRVVVSNESDVRLYANDFCKWTGVTCDNSTFPTGLSLGGLNLKGKIPPSIGGLRGLRSLDLSSNRLTGTLPTSMQSMTKLVAIDLSNNELSGPIPSFVTSLSKLTTFSASSNYFNGTIPIFLSNFLVSLNLNYNRFYGKISADSCIMLVNGTGLVINMRGNDLTCYETCWIEYATSRNVFDNNIQYCMPSSQPSSSPSSQPSIYPSSYPTSPSNQPTTQPSAFPSSRPTSPTSQPSNQPVRAPTFQPSRQPTIVPTLVPTAQPSSNPTNPSAKPSSHPSNYPSSKPSHPTSHPSRQPSRIPSCQPTVNPTRITQQPVSTASTSSSGVATTTVFIIVGIIVVVLLAAVVVGLRIASAHRQKVLYKGLPIHAAIMERRKIGEKLVEGDISTAYFLDNDNRTALDLWLERNAKSAVVDEFTLDLLYRIVAGDLPSQKSEESSQEVVSLHSTLPSSSVPYLDFFPILGSYIREKKSRHAAIDVELNLSERKRCAKGYCWTTIIQRNEDFAAQVVSRIMSIHKDKCDHLCFTLDSFGRKHLDIASIKCKLIMNKNRFLHERYDLKQGPPEHKSNTSLIRFATDQKSGGFSKSDYSHVSSSGALVAMKFMRNRDQFLSEINSRNVADFSPEYVVSLLHSYDGDSLEQDDVLFRQDAIVKGYLDYPYCAILTVADQNLKKVIDQQNICGKDWAEIQQIMRQLTTCIDHMHSKGYIHGDLKPSNIVLSGQKVLLIDLDASASFAPTNPQFAGAKFSSAYFPPEMLVARPDGSLHIRANIERVDGIKATDTESVVVSFELLPACPSYDMWSVGAILYLLSTGCSLLRATVDDTALESELQVLYDWSDSVTYERVSQITNKNARNLVSLLLRKDPLKRLSTKYVLSHPFLTGKKPVRLQGEQAYFDVFLSYRVDSDSDHVSMLYHALCARGLKVWWDKELLVPGQPWEDGFCAGLVNATTFVCLLSRGAVNHPHKPSQNFTKLSNTSRCDNLLLEWSLALELRERGMMHGIFPVFIGDKGVDGIYGDYFTGECHPFPIPNITIPAVSSKLQEHLDKQSLGAAYFEQTTVKQVVDHITAQQGGFIRGDGASAFDAVVERIVQMRLVA